MNRLLAAALLCTALSMAQAAERWETLPATPPVTTTSKSGYLDVNGAKLFYRKPDANTWGILNVREEFLREHPDIVRRVLSVYENARKYSIANYDELKKTFMAVTKLPDAVVDKQLKERTDLNHSRIGAPQRGSILAAGVALQQAGVIDPKVDVKAALDTLIDDQVALPTQ